MTTTAPDDPQRIARATLTYLAEPADPVVSGLLQVLSPAELLASTRSGTLPASVTSAAGGLPAALAAVTRWRGHLHAVPADAGLASFERQGIRLVCPGDPDWPVQLDDLGPERPYALWVRGMADLRSCRERAVSIVGSRAATAYGAHVAGEIAVSLVLVHGGSSGPIWLLSSGCRAWPAGSREDAR